MGKVYLEIHPDFKLNGKEFCISDLKSKNKSAFVNNSELFRFFKEWFNEKNTMSLKTSGSTGNPKNILIRKKDMVTSAKNTGEYFRLTRGNKALLCLPIKFIAGKMMIIRSIVLGLDLHIMAPTISPLKSCLQVFDFAAMTPLQLEKSILFLHKVKCLIVGGSPISDSLAKQVFGFSEVYETYGMTETVSHVAVKNLSRGEKYFSALPGITFSVKKDCLAILAPFISKTPILTNDNVDLISKTEFKWVGRNDFIINSAGIKLNPEEIENYLSSFFGTRFVISSILDKDFGEKVVIVFEKETPHNIDSVLNNLHKYERPKKVFVISSLRTINGKIDRNYIKNEILKLI
mgnify:CR=1 FL=1